MKRIPSLLLLGFGLLLACQTATAASKLRILGIAIEGNQTTDAGLIRAYSGLAVGKEISGDDVQSAIRQLWALGLFSDIQVLEEREVAEGVYLIVRVAEYPRLEKVELSGNRKLKKDDLESVIGLTPGQVLHQKDVVRLTNRLKAKYASKGFLLATVEPETYTSETTGRQVLKITIKEGKKVAIKRIEFEGNTAYSDKALRKQLKKTRRKTLFRSGEFNDEEFREDLKAVGEFYRGAGYRDFQISSDSASYTKDLRRMILAIRVEEGPIYHYGDITWSGNKLFTQQALEEKLQVRSGDLYNEKKFQQGLQDLGALYYDRGYINASVIPAETPRGPDTVDVHLSVAEGTEFKVRRISIEGNTKTKEKVIRRELVLYPGETFDVSRLRRSIREVTILNYFSNIVPDIVPVSENEVDLYIKVEEKSTDQAMVSAGYSQRDGFIGTVGFQMNNLLGNGHQFSLDWNFGKVYRSFSISFTEPWLFDTRTLVGASFFDTHRGGSYYGFDEDIIGGSLRLGRRLKWPDDYFRLDYIYRLDRTEYSNFAESFRATNPRGLRENVPRISSSLTQIVTRDSRDDPEFPTSGSVNSFRTELTGGPLGGHDQFIKANLSSQWYLPLPLGFVLVSLSEVGALDGLTRDPRDIPYFDYFFMGGSGLSLGTSLRGYDERAVGPQSGSYAVGGKTLFKQSMELRFPILKNPTIFLLTFTEAGNVWRSFEETNPTDLKRSVGFGVRLFMPFVGMIGLDYGLGLDYEDARGLRTTNWEPHFQFGRGF
ncbi:MAG: outer membrane protein assembly factor BamA [bacterium]